MLEMSDVICFKQIHNMSVNYFYKINYFDHFYFIRVYLNLFHVVYFWQLVYIP